MNGVGRVNVHKTFSSGRRRWLLRLTLGSLFSGDNIVCLAEETVAKSN